MWQRRGAMRVNAMLLRFLLAPLRCRAYVLLVIAGFVVFMLWVFASITIVAYRPATWLLRAMAGLHRRLAARWAGVAIDTGHRVSLEPERRPDGWYVHGNQLFKHRWFPAYLLEMEHLGQDKVLMREATWLFWGPAIAVIPLVPLALIVAGAVTWPFGAALIAAGVAVGPAFVALYERCARAMLRPPAPVPWSRRGVFGWINARNSAAWRAA